MAEPVLIFKLILPWYFLFRGPFVTDLMTCLALVFGAKQFASDLFIRKY